MDSLARYNIPLLRWFYAAQKAEMMIMPIIVLYWLGHGLTMAEVLFLQGFFSACVVAFEIPSGYFSDWFSRKTTVLLSGVFTTAGLCIYLVATDFISFFPAEICFALGMSFLSGTFESIAYESVPIETRAEDGPKVLGWMQEWYFVMLAVYGIVGAFVAQWFGYQWTIALAAAIVATSVIAAFLLREPPRVRAQDMGMSAREHLWDIVRGMLSNRTLLANFVIFGFLLGINRLGGWYYQPLMVAGGLDTIWLGVIFSLFYLFAAFGNRFARYATKRFWTLATTLFQAALLVLGYVIMARWTTSFGWIGIMFPRVAVGMSDYLQPTEINTLASDDRRATLHSFASLSGRTIYSALLFAAGVFIAGYSLSATFWIFAALSTLLFIIIALSVAFFGSVRSNFTKSTEEDSAR